MTIRELIEKNKDLDSIQIHTTVTLFGHSFSINLGNYEIKYNTKPYITLVNCHVPLEAEVEAWWCTTLRCLSVIIREEKTK